MRAASGGFDRPPHRGHRTPPRWLEQALSWLAPADEVERVKKERAEVKERLWRLGMAFVDRVHSDADCKRQEQALESELVTVVVPGVNAAEDAGRPVQRLPALRAEAAARDRNELLRATFVVEMGRSRPTPGTTKWSGGCTQRARHLDGALEWMARFVAPWGLPAWRLGGRRVTPYTPWVIR